MCLVVNRIGAALIAALLAGGSFAPATFAASSTTTSTKVVPKVVFIVGPAGSATDSYRTQARAAAVVARRYTPDVTELYSPFATWPAVKKALDGASLVVYMGHGNGWPSKYRDALYPPTQNGFGLNPTTDSGDFSHQYFGEAAIAAQIKLAKNAVVVLNHLCYASGMAEPDLPEATLDQARQRVDNYAAGFIAAGAAAVIAEAWPSSSYFVKAILGGGRSIQGAWQDSPYANGHRLAFKSARSPGYVAQIDTETASSGYTRSIVMKAGLTPKDVLAGAAGSRFGATSPSTLGPTLVGTGIRLGLPDIAGLSAGAATHVDVPFTIPYRYALPKRLKASVRWDPIDVAVAPVDLATGSGTPATVDPAAADPLPKDPPVSANVPVEVPPAASSVPDITAKIAAPVDEVGLVVPELVGDVVAPTSVKIGKSSLIVPVRLPTVAGRYRLTITLHDTDGVAYDAATQALLSTLRIRVVGDFDGAIQVTPTAELAAGKGVSLGIRVTNLGSTDWGHAATKPTSNLSGWIKAERAIVVARWIPLSLGAALPIDPAAQSASADLPIALKPGKSAEASLILTAPNAAGQYLLLLDVVTPERGSLLASGVEASVVRVTVVTTK